MGLMAYYPIQNPSIHGSYFTGRYHKPLYNQVSLQLSNYEFFFSVLCFFGILLVLQFFGHQLFKTIRVCLDSIQHLEFCVFNVFSGSRALFIRPASTFFHKNNFKIGSHSTIHTFKNYFATLFSDFSNKRYPNRPLVTSKNK